MMLSKAMIKVENKELNNLNYFIKKQYISRVSDPEKTMVIIRLFYHFPAKYQLTSSNEATVLHSKKQYIKKIY